MEPLCYNRLVFKSCLTIVLTYSKSFKRSVEPLSLDFLESLDYLDSLDALEAFFLKEVFG